MPRLWNDTIDEHRRSVREAVLDAAGALVAAHGLHAVTMSRIAEDSGIGRATLYKYFPDLESILRAWHERQVSAHLRNLAEIRNRADAPLEAVLEAYALSLHEGAPHGDADLSALIHRGEHVAHAQQHLVGLIGELIGEAAQSGQVRGDVAPQELATFCLHALTAAGRLQSRAAVRRLVAVTVSGLRPAGAASRTDSA